MSLDFYITFRYCKCCDYQREPLHFNITHNLCEMAQEAGLYDCLWHPKDHRMFFTDDILLPLSLGLDKLKANPTYYKQFDSDNGWGLYEHFVPFCEEILEACTNNPEARIETST